MRTQGSAFGDVLELTGAQRRLAVFEQELAARIFNSQELGDGELGSLKAWLKNLEAGVAESKLRIAAKRRKPPAPKIQ